MDRNPISEIERFLKLLGEAPKGATPIFCVPGEQGWKHFKTPQPGECYVGSSLVRSKKRLTRKREDLISARVIVLDDIGTKANEPPIEPNCILETSKGNFQYIYRINEEITEESYSRITNFLKDCAENGWTDGGGLSPGRVFRIPGSLNTKHSPSFKTRVKKLDTEKVWSLEELSTAFSVKLRVTTIRQFEDEVLKWLNDHRLAGEPRQGWVNIVCPWKEDHTPGRDDYAGYSYVGGGENPFNRVFKCHHNSCKERKIGDFLDWVKDQGGPQVEPLGLTSLPVSLVEDVKENLTSNEKREFLRVWAAEVSAYDLPDARLNAKGQPAMKQLATQSNIFALASKLNIEVRMNMMEKRDYFSFKVPQIKALAELDENVQAYRTLVDTALRLGISTSKEFEDCLRELGTIHQYHPFADWIKSKPWDGVSRLGEFMDTVISEDRNKTTYIKRWLVQGVQAAFNWKNPKQIRAVLVFAGEQQIGKTEWFKALAPTEFRQEGVQLELKSFTAKDSIIRATQYPLVELGEMDTTFSKSEAGAIKNFLSQSHDVYRSPYGRRPESWPRCTSFYGSVNNVEFLVDETGSSRFWPLQVEECVYEHGIDMQQLWAEVYELWRAGEPYWLLSGEERERLKGASMFTRTETICDMFDIYMSEHSGKKEWMNLAEIAKTVKAGYMNPRERGILSAYIRKVVGPPKSYYKGKRNVWEIPIDYEPGRHLKEVKIK